MGRMIKLTHVYDYKTVNGELKIRTREIYVNANYIMALVPGYIGSYKNGSTIVMHGAESHWIAETPEEVIALIGDDQT